MAAAPYEHRQIGWAILGICGVITVAMSVGGLTVALQLTLALMGAIVLLFGTLTSRVDGEQIEARFGVGLIRRRLPLTAVQSYGPARSHWLVGYGIRRIRRGWLWNVSGVDSVELRLKRGRVFRIGTDEPERFCEAIAAVAPDLPRHAAPLGENGRDIGTRWLRRSTGFVVVMLITGLALGAEALPPRIELGDDALTVSSLLFRARVPRDTITSVEIIDELPRFGRRTWGYSNGRHLRGWFQVRGAPVQVFVDRRSPPFLRVRTEDNLLIVHDHDPAATHRLHDQLMGGRELGNHAAQPAP